MDDSRIYLVYMTAGDKDEARSIGLDPVDLKGTLGIKVLYRIVTLLATPFLAATRSHSNDNTFTKR